MGGSGDKQNDAKAASSRLRTDRLKTIIIQHKVSLKQTITQFQINSVFRLTVIFGLIDLGSSNAAYAKRL